MVLKNWKYGTIIYNQCSQYDPEYVAPNMYDLLSSVEQNILSKVNGIQFNLDRNTIQNIFLSSMEEITSYRFGMTWEWE